MAKINAFFFQIAKEIDLSFDFIYFTLQRSHQTLICMWSVFDTHYFILWKTRRAKQSFHYELLVSDAVADATMAGG